MKYKLIYTLLLLLPTLGIAQIFDPYDLEKSLPDLQGIEKLSALNELRVEFFHRNRIKSAEYASQAINLAKSFDTTSFNSQAFLQIGIAHLNTGLCNEAETYFKRLIEFAKNNQIEEQKSLIDIYYNAGRLDACKRRLVFDEIHFYNHNDSSKNFNELIKNEIKLANDEITKFNYSLSLIEKSNLSLKVKAVLNGRIFYQLGLSYCSRKEYEKTFECYIKGYENYKNISQVKHAAGMLAAIGGFYRAEIQNYNKAIEYSQRAIIENNFPFNTTNLSNANKSNIDELYEIANFFANIGFSYYNLNDYKNALNYYLKLYEIDRILYDTSSMVNNLNYIGRAYYELENYDYAGKYYDTVLLYAQHLENLPATAQTHYNKGLLFAELNRFHLSIEHFNIALNLREKIGWYLEMGHTYNRIAEVNEKRGNFKEAEKNFNSALKIAMELQNVEFVNDIHLKLSILFEKANNHNKSLYHFKLHKNISDSLVKQKQNELIIRQQVNFDLESKEQDLIRQKEEGIKENRQKFILYSIVSISLITIAFLIILLYYLRYKNRLKREYIYSEQKALRSQMNPHFIFNSLGSIQNFVLKQDSDTANDYLAKFSSLIRQVLENSKYNTISLQQEMESIKTYLSLEQLRFEDKFSFHISIPDELPLSIIELPPMLIQPFLENAILHGITPLKGKGHIELSIIQESSNKLKIIIEDNGIGREQAAEINKHRLKHKSTGMKNVEDRLRMLCKIHKAEFKYKIEDLFGSDGKSAGTRVMMEIPVND